MPASPDTTFPSCRFHADNLVIVDVAEARKQINQRTKDLGEDEAMVVQSRDTMGAEPIFKGTRIPVRLAQARNHEAWHVNYLGLSGASFEPHPVLEQG